MTTPPPSTEDSKEIALNTPEQFDWAMRLRSELEGYVGFRIAEHVERFYGDISKCPSLVRHAEKQKVELLSMIGARLRALPAPGAQADAEMESAKAESRCGSCGWPYPCECGFMPKPEAQQVAVGLLRAVEKARGGTAPKGPMCMPGTLKVAGPCPRCKGEGWTDEGDPDIGSAPFECDWCLGTQKEHTCGQQASCAPCEERDRRIDAARATEAKR